MRNINFSKNLFFFLIYALYINLSVYSINTHKIDSLNKVLKNATDTHKVSIYINLGDLYESDSLLTAIRYYHTGINFSNELLKKYSSKNDTSITNFLIKKSAVLNLYLGIAYQSNSDFEKAKLHYIEAQKLFSKINHLKQVTDCLNNIGNLHILKSEFEIAINYYKQALEIAEKINNIDLLSRIYNNIGIIQIYMDNFNSGIEYLTKSLEYSEKLGDKKGVAYSLNNIGNIYFRKKDFKNSLEYFNKALKINEEIQDKPGQSRCLNNIGLVYKNLEDYNKALIYYNRALHINESVNDYQGIASCTHNIGNIYYNLKRYNESIVYATKCIDAAKKIDAKNELKDGYSLIALAYDKIGDYKNALEYFKEYSNLKDTILNQDKHKNISDIEAKYQNDKKKLEIEMLNKENEIQKINIEKSEVKQAKQRIIIYSFVLGFIIILIFSVLLYRQFSAKKKANILLEKQKKDLEFANTEILQQKEEILTQAEQLEATNKELEKLSIVASETDNSVIIADSEGNIEWANQSFTKLTGFSLIEFKERFGTNLIQVSANENINEIISECKNSKKSVIYSAKNLTKDNKTLWIQTTLTPILDSSGSIYKLIAIDSDITKIKEAEEEIVKQRDKITEQNKEITDSIKYASFIQNAILPPENTIKELLKNYFIIYKPRNIVSGDFYWAKNINYQNNKLSLIAVADCTGHGVPGAFMSMLSISLLNEICISHNFINTKKEEITSQILNNLRTSIIKSLHQTGDDDEAKDGLDISLVCIDNNENQLIFSGANNPIYIVTNYELQVINENNSELIADNKRLIELKPDKMPIGIHIKENPLPFKSSVYKFNNGDIVYLFSDGIIDQFGGKNGKRLKISGIKKILSFIAEKELIEQEKFINNELYNWLNPSEEVSFEQIDDITIMAFKI